MNKSYIPYMKSKNTHIAYWRSPAFRRGYIDGLTAFAFLPYPYKPKPIMLPTVHNAWEEVGAFMSGAIVEYSESEEAKGQKGPDKKRRVKA